MKHIIALTALLILGSALFALLPLEPIYSSGPFGAQQIGLLTWSDRADSLVYYQGNSPQTITLEPSNFGAGWISGILPLPDHPYVGYRGQADELRVNPVFWDQGTAVPLSHHILVETDPAGDNLFSGDFLDILHYKAGFSSERLSFAIKNNSTEFPVSSGTTFFAYMVLLVDPASVPDDNPIVYGLMYTVDLGTIISPGLYKISGTGLTDQVRIGDISSSVDPQSELLLLSCALSDLAADADFSSWFDPDYPLIGTGVITSRITLTSGVQQADAVASAQLLFKPQLMPTANSFAPLLENPGAEYIVLDDQYVVRFHIAYTDADQNFPRVAEFLPDGGGAWQLQPNGEPQDLDFSSAVTFRTEGIPLAPPWNGQFRFSHGDEFVYLGLYPTAVNDDFMPGLSLSIHPNPARGSITLDPGTKLEGALDVSLYNPRGQRVKTWNFISPDTGPLSLDLRTLPAGIYFLRLRDTRGSRVKRFVKLD
ncbi:MAG: T9SS type A sorting domain-containing protein [Candidatus Syntrophosphaera sp.]|nr:T9SS type A sorting domain-containing protein [Candidatus Syntrophosphaera sp.]